MLDNYLFRTRNTDLAPLTNFLLSSNRRSLLNDMQVHLGPYWPIEVVGSMSRWLEVLYTWDAVEHSGRYGVALKTSDALRWLADETNRDSAYLLGLAKALDDDPMERPIVGNARHERELLVAEYDALLAEMLADRVMWSPTAISFVQSMAGHAERSEKWGLAPMPYRIPFPADYLPGGWKINLDGYGGEILSTSWLLRNAVRRAEYLSEDERDSMKKALLFYPDVAGKVEIFPVSEPTFTICSPTVSRDHSPRDLGSVLGSMDFDGIDGTFSANPHEHAFRLYRAFDLDPDDDSCVYAVSDKVAYHFCVNE